MQFLSAGRYIANVADEKVTLYKKSAATPSPATELLSSRQPGCQFYGQDSGFSGIYRADARILEQTLTHSDFARDAHVKCT